MDYKKISNQGQGAVEYLMLCLVIVTVVTALAPRFKDYLMGGQSPFMKMLERQKSQFSSSDPVSKYKYFKFL
jgi:hypothetical protein